MAPEKQQQKIELLKTSFKFFFFFFYHFGPFLKTICPSDYIKVKTYKTNNEGSLINHIKRVHCSMISKMVKCVGSSRTLTQFKFQIKMSKLK